MKRVSHLNIFTHYKSQLVLVVVTSLVFTLTNIAIRIFLGEVVDKISVENLGKNVLIGLVFLVILILSNLMSTYHGKKYCGLISMLLLNNLSHYLFTADYDNISRKTEGDTTTLISTDTTILEQYCNRIISGFIPDLFFFVASLTYLFVIDFKLMLLALTAACFTVLITSKQAQRLSRHYSIMRKHTVETNQLLGSDLEKIEEIKSFQIEESRFEIYLQQLNKLTEISRKSFLIESLLSIPILFSGFSTIVVIAIYGGNLVANGEITLGTLMSVMMVADFIIDPIMKLGGTLSIARKAKLSCESFNNFFENHTLSLKKAIGCNLQKKAFELKKVEFGYGNTTLFTNIDMEFEVGKPVFITGKIGSGKSTLVKIMAGLYSPISGQVILNGLQLDQYDRQEVQSKITVVSQDCPVFSGTIFDNLIMANPSVSFEKIKKICQKVGLDGEIVLKETGYDTFLGEAGYGMSGGQLQRLSIARALLVDSEVVIMDEPTSALDKKNREHIRTVIEELSKDKIVIVVSHDRELISDNVEYDIGGRCFVKKRSCSYL